MRKYPHLQRAAALEGAEAADDRDPRLLDDLLGDRVAGDVAARHPAHAPGQPVDEVGEGVLLAAAQAVEQVLGGHTATLRDTGVK